MRATERGSREVEISQSLVGRRFNTRNVASSSIPKGSLMNAPASDVSSNHAAEKYRVLLEITNALVSNLDPDALFKAIAIEIKKITTFDRAGITLYDQIGRASCRERV